MWNYLEFLQHILFGSWKHTCICLLPLVIFKWLEDSLYWYGFPQTPSNAAACSMSCLSYTEWTAPGFFLLREVTLYISVPWASAETVVGLHLVMSPIVCSEKPLQWYSLCLINEQEMLHPLIILGHGSGEFLSAAHHYTWFSSSKGCLPAHKHTHANTWHHSSIKSAKAHSKSPVVGPDAAIMV